MKKFKYAIFDMDGTLLDSMSDWKNACRNYLNKNGINVPENLDEVLKPFTLNEAALYIKNELNVENSVEEIVTSIYTIMEYKYKYEFKLKPYVKEYLDKLKKECVNMCVATATAFPLAEVALNRLGILQHFSFILTCDDVGVGKIKPDIYNVAANRLDAVPEDIVVYEDALYAMKTSKNAGFFTVGVYDHTVDNTREEIELHCDRYVESFEELI